MKMCQPHWDELKQAIKDRGLYHLVAKEGHEAVDRMKKDLNGELSQFDPLMSANMSIWQAALNAGGLYLMGIDEQGNEYCPLCECEKNLPGGAKAWIKDASDCSLKFAQENNLMDLDN